MSVEPVAGSGALDDRSPRDWQPPSSQARVIALAVAGVFVLIGGASLDLGPIEARLGMAAAEGFGPMGQVFGGWEPGLWPGQLAPSMLWAMGEEGPSTAASVRWPTAIAAILAGLVLSARAMRVLGNRAGLLTMLCWCGSLGLIDRSAAGGLDLIAGLATVAALDQIVGRRSVWIAGCWAALAFLAAGWPPLAIVVLSTVVIGRQGTGLAPGLLVPPVLAAVAWSLWTLRVVPAEAWAAALALPLTQKPAWFLALGVLTLGLPWSPFAALVALRPVRDGWPEPGRRLVLGWLQVAGACLVAGTVIPGLATAARLPALAGIAVVAAACCDRLWAEGTSAVSRHRFVGLGALIAAFWITGTLLAGIYLATGVSYYRGLAIILILLTVPVVALVVRSVATGDPRRMVIAMVLVSLCLKLAHCGYYVPEWNYRRSQGPWGRAIGQWIPPGWPVYTTHAWAPDLAFAIGRPVRELAHPKLLGFLKTERPSHVLLLESEFDHWPNTAPAIVKVATFQDERGSMRVLARTKGEVSWRMARLSRED